MAAAVALVFAQAALAQTCGTPGTDGPGPAGSAAGTVVNTYYAGSSGSVGTGSTSIVLGTSSGAAVAWTAGDMALVIQMQGASYNSTSSTTGTAGAPVHNTTYGDGSSGAGFTALSGVGRYEFVRVASVAGSTLNIVGAGPSSGLVNTYNNTGSARYQVVRVPQYSSMTLTSNLAPARWNGAAGGVLAIDVAGRLTFSGGSLNAANLGFRGGRGRALAGSNLTSNLDDCNNSTVNAHGAKGEGIAGQSLNLNNPVNNSADTGADNYTCSFTNTTLATPNNGTTYTSAQQARGGPGNAGGGGNDANPGGNDQNAGGGGGAGFGNGGKGGNSWSSNLPFGGYGGIGVPQTASLLTMGGGGGAGARNNSADPQSSGGAGGGIVIVRAGSIAGTGTINVSGQSIPTNDPLTPANDGGGGGGGGGAALIIAASNGGGTVTVNAAGGRGSDAWPTDNGGIGDRHGPGGGGGGGFVANTPTVSVVANNGRGSPGITTTLNDTYGAAQGTDGGSNPNVALTDVPGVGAGASCLPQLTITKQTVAAQPVTKSPGDTVLYRITASNLAGRGDAATVTLTDPLPTNWLFQPTTVATNLTGGATRTTNADSAAATNTPSFGTFRIPGGSSASVDFNVLIPTGANAGTYQNPANTTYLDPTRTAANSTVTPGGTYAGGGTVGGSNYVATSSVAEDVKVVTVSPVVVNKVFSPASDRTAPYQSTMTITINNPGTATVNSISVSDPYPGSNPTGGQMTDNGAVSNTCGGIASLAGNTLTVGTFSLAPGASCTIVRNVQVSNSTTTRTYSNEVTVSATAMANVKADADFVSGTGANGPPVLTKTITPGTIAAGGTANMALTITNNNTLTAMGNTNPMTDNFPSGLTTTAGSFVARSCNGLADSNPFKWTSTANSVTLTLGSTQISPGNNCTATVPVTAGTPGVYTNNYGTFLVTTPSVGDSNQATAVLKVVGPPTVTKSFTPSSIATGNAATMGITVTNPSSNPDNLSAVAISDSYAGGLVNQGAATFTCVDGSGGTISTGTLTGGTNGGTAVGFNNATLPPGGSCTITQKVTATATYTNTTGTPSTTINGVTINGTAASATLTVNTLSPPTVSKNFAANSISPGGTTTLTITLNNPNAATLGTMTLTSPFTDNLPTSNTSQPMTVASLSSLSTTCGGAVSSTGVGVSPASVTLASGSTIPAGGCTISVDVKVNSTINSTYVNTIPVGALVTNGGSNAAAASDTLLVPGPPTVSKAFTPASIAVNGTSTLTINLTSPTGATVTNVTLTDPLPSNVVAAATPAITNTCGGSVSVSNTTPQQLILTSGSVPAAGCKFTLNVTSAVAGVYDNNIPAANLTSSGGTPGSGTIASARLTVGATNTITGRVFTDNGSGGGTANDGILGTGEGGGNTGIPNLVVRLTNCAATTISTTQTDALGNYSFAGPAATATVCVVADSQPGVLNTGASVGVTALPTNLPTTVGGVSYTFCRASTDACAAQGVRSIKFAYVAGTSYTGLNFGQVPQNQFVSDGAQQGPAGSSFSYIQVYTAGTGGVVSFSPTVTATVPATPGWNEVLHLDTNCDGSIAPTETTIVTAASTFTLTAGAKVCLVLTEFAPAGAPDGAERVVTVNSNFTYTNANPSLPAQVLAVVDTTKVGSADGLTLRKEVCNSTAQIAAGSSCDPSITGATAGRGFALSNTGAPGDVLIYRLIYSNPGTKPSTNLVVNDTTPPYTVAATPGASCSTTPAGMTCTVAAQPAIGAAGSFRWTFTGTLASGAKGVVLMTISITPQ